MAVVVAHGLQERILLPGFAGNLADWYERADIYAMTTSFEGFPNSMLEALAHGRASIAFDVLAGLRELSDGGRRFMLLPDRDHADELTEALRAFMSSAGLREQFAATAKEVTHVYSEQNVLTQWDNLFAACMVSGKTAEPKL